MMRVTTRSEVRWWFGKNTFMYGWAAVTKSRIEALLEEDHSTPIAYAARRVYASAGRYLQSVCASTMYTLSEATQA